MKIMITVNNGGNGYFREFDKEEIRTMLEWLSQYAEIGEITWIPDTSED